MQVLQWSICIWPWSIQGKYI